MPFRSARPTWTGSWRTSLNRRTRPPYADNLKKAGVAVDARTFDGVTHEFFGMAKVMPDAKAAVDLVNADLRKAFAK